MENTQLETEVKIKKPRVKKEKIETKDTTELWTPNKYLEVLQVINDEEFKILLTVCEEVEVDGSPEFEEEMMILGMLKDSMREICVKKHWIGLASNQIGVLKRFFYMLNTDTMYINPKILKYDWLQLVKEWCLSRKDFLPQTMRRYKNITVEYMTLDKEIIVEKLKWKDAIVFQHELDHLNGNPV